MAPQSAEFIAEAKEHLADVCDQLLRCERAAGDAAKTMLEAMLRAVHSVKGGAGFFGLRSIETLAHRMESLVESLMEGTVPRDSHAIDALLAGTDRIAAMLDDAEHSNDFDIADLLARIDALQAPPNRDAATPDAAPTPVVAAPTTVELEINLTQAEAGGAPPAEVVRRLEQLSEITAAEIVPSATRLEDWSPTDPVSLRVRLATALSSDEVWRQLRLPDETPPTAVQPSVAPESGEVATAEVAVASSVDRGGTMRVPVGLADRLMNLAGELVLVRNRSRQIAETSQPLPIAVMQRLDGVTRELQDTILQTRMQPVGTLFNKFPRLVRDLARQLGKQLELRIEGAEVELDKTILDAISDPLTHLVRNACDHGIERPEERTQRGKSPTGRVTLTALHLGDQIRITVADDGAGIDAAAVRRQALKQGLRTEQTLAQLSDADVLALVMLPGLSTAEQVSEVSGRGVGMDVVKSNLSQLGGAVEIASTPGMGTTFTLRLPLTLAIIPSLLVTAAGRRYAIPQKDLEELVFVDAEQSRARIERGAEQDYLRLRDRLLPLVDLSELLRSLSQTTSDREAAPSSNSVRLLAIVKAGGRRYAMAVDNVLTSEEIVVKPMHTQLRQLRHYSGATILGDGHVALILDTSGVADAAQLRFGSDASAARTEAAAKRETQAVLLVRIAAGELYGVPVFQVRRLAMVRRAELERLAAGCFVAIDGVPARLVSIDGRDVASDGAEYAFALLPRDTAEPVGVVVDEVLGTELVDLRRLTALEEHPETMGVVPLRGRITPIIDLYHIVGQRESRASSSQTAKRILLVDDTQFFREVVGGYLDSVGYEVTKVEHGAAAMERLEREPFDLIVSDLEMPELDGWKLAATVRQSAQPFHAIPMLALSTLSAEQAEASALASGFDAFEVKLDRATLLAKIDRLLAPRGQAMSRQEAGR